MVLLIMSFSNVPKKKKGRKKIIFSFYIIMYVLLAFHVMIHFSLCVRDSFLHFSIARQKKKMTIDFFSLYALFS